MENRIPLHLLETLLYFYKYRTVVLAAEELKVTQPTVSRNLVLLESYFELPLFKWQGKKKVFTTYGIDIVKSVEQSYLLLEESLLKTQRIHFNEELNTLKVGGRKEFLHSLFDLIQFKGCFEFVYLGSSEVVKSILEDHLDLAISHENIETYNYQNKKVITDYPQIIIPKKFLKSPLKLEQWAKECVKHPAIAYAQHRIFLQQYAKIFKIPLESLPIKGFIPGWDVIENKVHEGMGWSIVPGLFVKKHRNYHIILFPKTAEYSYPIYLYYKKDLSKIDWFKKILAQFEMISHN